MYRLTRKLRSVDHVSPRQQCIILKMVKQAEVQWKGLTLEEPTPSRCPLYQVSMQSKNIYKWGGGHHNRDIISFHLRFYTYVGCFVKSDHFWARILVQVTIYRRLLIGRDGHLDQSEAYDIS